MKTKEEMALSIENIFKNTKNIHGNSKSIDWIKVASYKAAGYLLFDQISQPSDVIQGEYYRKVYIKSEADLPKEDGLYLSQSHKGILGDRIFGEYEKEKNYAYHHSAKFWLDNIDWYLQPIADKAPIESKDPTEKQFAELEEYFNIKHKDGIDNSIPPNEDKNSPAIEPQKQEEGKGDSKEPKQWHLNCTKCGRAYWFNQPFPAFQLCNECLRTKEKDQQPATPVSAEILSDTEIHQWIEDQKYQTDYSGEYRMYFGIDMPKILRNFLIDHPTVNQFRPINVPTVELKQYITNLLYFARTQGSTNIKNSTFDKWAEEMIDRIDEYFKAQPK